MTALRDIAIAFLSVLVLRLVVVRLLPKSLGWKRSAIAYGGLIALVGISLLVLALSEMPLYGFDKTYPRHLAGYWAMWIGVLGAVGIPIVALLDTVTALLKGWLRRQPWLTPPRTR
jgi:hypothetical protein